MSGSSIWFLGLLFGVCVLGIWLHWDALRHRYPWSDPVARRWRARSILGWIVAAGLIFVHTFWYLAPWLFACYATAVATSRDARAHEAWIDRWQNGFIDYLNNEGEEGGVSR